MSGLLERRAIKPLRITDISNAVEINQIKDNEIFISEGNSRIYYKNSDGSIVDFLSAIDRSITELQNTVDGLEITAGGDNSIATEITNIKSRVSLLENTVGSLATKQELTNEITNISRQVLTITNDVSGIRNTLTTLNNGYVETFNRVSTLLNDFTALRNEFNNIYELSQSINEGIQALLDNPIYNVDPETGEVYIIVDAGIY